MDSDTINQEAIFCEDGGDYEMDIYDYNYTYT